MDQSQAPNPNDATYRTPDQDLKLATLFGVLREMAPEYQAVVLVNLALASHVVALIPSKDKANVGFALALTMEGKDRAHLLLHLTHDVVHEMGFKCSGHEQFMTAQSDEEDEEKDIPKKDVPRNPRGRDEDVFVGVPYTGEQLLHIKYNRELRKLKKQMRKLHKLVKLQAKEISDRNSSSQDSQDDSSEATSLDGESLEKRIHAPLKAQRIVNQKKSPAEVEAFEKMKARLDAELDDYFLRTGKPRDCPPLTDASFSGNMLMATDMEEPKEIAELVQMLETNNLATNASVDAIVLMPAESDEIRKISIQNLDYGASEKELWMHFKDCGDIEVIEIIVDQWTGKPQGRGYVTFSREESVMKALYLNGRSFRGKALHVSITANCLDHRNPTSIKPLTEGSFT